MNRIRNIREKLNKIGKNRLLLLIFLLLILTDLCFYYVENFSQHEDYPSIKDVLSSYPEGQLVSISGTVIQTFPGGFDMYDYDSGVLFKFTVYSGENVSARRPGFGTWGSRAEQPDNQPEDAGGCEW